MTTPPTPDQSGPQGPFGPHDPAAPPHANAVAYPVPGGTGPYAQGTSPSGSGSKARTGLIVGGVAGALLLGGGAFAVSRVLSGDSGDDPSSALPATTVGYVSVDISPGVGQQIAGLRFLEGLDPEVREVLESEDFRQALFDKMAEDQDIGVDWDQDIAPWLGDRVGMGVVPDGDDEPMVAVAVQVTDQDAARQSLEDLAAESADTQASWFFHDDYVVFTEPDDLGDMEAAVQAGTLSGEATFVDDMEALGDPGLMAGWVDIQAAAGLPGMRDMEELESVGGAPGMISGFMGAAPDTADVAAGRVAMTLRLGEDYVEVSGIGRGQEELGIEGGDSAQLVLGLPDDTAVALGLEHGDQFVGAAWDYFSELAPDEVSQLEQEASAEGWTLPGDIQTLVGQSLAISVGPDVVSAAMAGGMEGMAQLPVAYQVQTDVPAANELLDRALTQSGAPAEALARAEGDGVLTLGLDQSYVDEVAAGGALGEDEQFQSAVPGAADADGIMYVDLDTFEDFYLGYIDDATARDAVESLSAVGYSIAVDGDESAFTFRVVTNSE